MSLIKESECIKTLYDWYLNGVNGDKTKCSVRKLTLECIAHNFPTYLHSTRNVNKTLKEEAYTGYKITNNRRKILLIGNSVMIMLPNILLVVQK